MASRPKITVVLWCTIVLGTVGGVAYLAWTTSDNNPQTRLVSPPVASTDKDQLKTTSDDTDRVSRMAAAVMEEGLAAYNRGDYATALLAFRLLAESRTVTARFKSNAHYRLGLMHDFVYDDREQAARHFSRAAELGHVKAQLRLSERYYSAVGVALDYVRAYMWSSVAAKLVENEFDKHIAVGNRDDLAEIMSPAEIAKAQKLALAWLAEFEKKKN